MRWLRRIRARCGRETVESRRSEVERKAQQKMLGLFHWKCLGDCCASLLFLAHQLLELNAYVGDGNCQCETCPDDRQRHRVVRLVHSSEAGEEAAFQKDDGDRVTARHPVAMLGYVAF